MAKNSELSPKIRFYIPQDTNILFSKRTYVCFDVYLLLSYSYSSMRIGYNIRDRTKILILKESKLK